jgi:hypothetical protein
MSELLYKEEIFQPAFYRVEMVSEASNFSANS